LDVLYARGVPCFSIIMTTSKHRPFAFCRGGHIVMFGLKMTVRLCRSNLRAAYELFAARRDKPAGAWQLAALVLCAACAVTGAIAEPPDPARTTTTSWPGDAELEARQTRIGLVKINSRPIFDPEVPGENTAFFRLADRLHIDTRPSVIEAQLLFRPGDLYSRRVLDETERNLRTLRFIREPKIRVIAYHDGLVDLEVVTHEVWTLNPGISFGRAGGKNSTGVTLDEFNVLGHGKRLSFSYHDDVDRNYYTLIWEDPNVAGSRWRSRIDLTDSNDGEDQELDLERPFYSLDSRWSAGISLNRGDTIESVYRLGKIVGEYQRTVRDADLHYGWSKGLQNGWARRWIAGLRYEEARFAESPDSVTPVILPLGHDLGYPYLRLEGVEDDFQTALNLDQIGRTEDLPFGKRYAVELGWAATAYGSDRDAAMLRAEASRGFHVGDDRSLFVASSLTSRIEDGSARDALLSGYLRYYWQISRRSTFFSSLSGQVGHQLDADHELLLGGDNGLRGYPLRYQTGSGLAMLTIEQRYYTKYSIWKLARIGGAVFFDMGRTWGQSAFGPTAGLGLLKDFGFGLRLDNTRSGLANVLHLDIAFPLDGDPSIDQVQILVQSKRSF
jgi:hypothetical protein